MTASIMRMKKHSLLLVANLVLQQLLLHMVSEASLPGKRAVGERLHRVNPTAKSGKESRQIGTANPTHSEQSSVPENREKVAALNLPIVTRRLRFPPPDLSRIRPAALTARGDDPHPHTPVRRGLSNIDNYLMDTFPGYFHELPEIQAIDQALSGRRHKRDTDGDLCCKT